MWLKAGVCLRVVLSQQSIPQVQGFHKEVSLYTGVFSLTPRNYFLRWQEAPSGSKLMVRIFLINFSNTSEYIINQMQQQLATAT